MINYDEVVVTAYNLDPGESIYVYFNTFEEAEAARVGFYRAAKSRNLRVGIHRWMTKCSYVVELESLHSPTEV